MDPVQFQIPLENPLKGKQDEDSTDLKFRLVYVSVHFLQVNIARLHQVHHGKWMNVLVQVNHLDLVIHLGQVDHTQQICLLDPADHIQQACLPAPLYLLGHQELLLFCAEMGVRLIREVVAKTTIFALPVVVEAGK